MASAVTTTVTELPDSRVSVDVEVAAEEVQRSLERQAARLGREMKVPGFRTGKIPPAIVIQRVGRGPLLDEVIRGRLTDWYMSAIETAGIAPVGDPELDLGEPPGEGRPLTFSFQVGVRPTAALGDYRGIEVPRREPSAEPAAVDAQLEEMRERLARLEDVDRPAQEGDYVLVDYVGTIDGEPFEGGEARDQLVEIGAGLRIEGFEEGLIGARAGERRTVEATFPDGYAVDSVAGRTAVFEFDVKEVKRRELPALDDALADAAGFESLDELRSSIAEELLERDRKRVEAEFRASAIDAVAERAQIDVPEELVRARAQEQLDRVLHSLSHQGIGREQYLALTGKSEQELLDEALPDADRALRREAVLEAIIAAEAIEPGEEQLLEALAGAAEREQVAREKLLERLRKAGRVDALAKEVAAEQAIDLVVESATPVPTVEGEEGAKAPAGGAGAGPRGGAKTAKGRRKPAGKQAGEQAAKRSPGKRRGGEAGELWTPDQDSPEGAEGKLWTPGG